MLADFSFSSSSRPSTASVPRRTSSTTILAQCSLPDLNHDHPRPVLSAGPQSRPSTPSVPCRASTTTIHVQCSLPDVDHDHPRPSVRCRAPTAIIHAQRFCRTPTPPSPKPCQIECQKLCQLDCQTPCEMVSQLCITAMVQRLGIVSDTGKWSQQAVLPSFCYYTIFPPVRVLSFYAS